MKNISTIFALLSLALVPVMTISAQNVSAAYSISKHDLNGTARFMSMGGAFGALGGDLSCLSQNPGGIGVYRSNEISATFGIDVITSNASSGGISNKESTTRFNLNNIGGVFTLKLNSETVPNINIGFTYNKVASFNRKFAGAIPNLGTSMSNYIAGISNSAGLSVNDVVSNGSYDPYNPPAGYPSVPWLSIMGFDAFLTDADVIDNQTVWYGQFGDGTSGTGRFSVNEKGSIDEYNIAIGGNISDKFFWGMDFGITSIDYRISTLWSESLSNAYIYDPNSQRLIVGNSDWSMFDNYKVHGSGFNYKLGFIYKPVQELRLGFAFHTPTFYNLTENYYDARMMFDYPFRVTSADGVEYNTVDANYGIPAYNDYSFRTPWRIIASVAGVIGSKFIISADYEWNSTNGMRYGDPKNYGYDPWYDDPWYDYPFDPYYANKTKSSGFMPETANQFANRCVKSMYKDTNTIRIGAEYRIIPRFSVRAGYSWTSSPISEEITDYKVSVSGTGITSNYNLDNDTHNITCGIGYKNKGFFADLAYVYTNSSSEYFPFPADIDYPANAVKSKVKFDKSRIAVTLGFKF